MSDQPYPVVFLNTTCKRKQLFKFSFVSFVCVYKFIFTSIYFQNINVTLVVKVNRPSLCVEFDLEN